MGSFSAVGLTADFAANLGVNIKVVGEKKLEEPFCSRLSKSNDYVWIHCRNGSWDVFLGTVLERLISFSARGVIAVRPLNPE